MLKYRLILLSMVFVFLVVAWSGVLNRQSAGEVSYAQNSNSSNEQLLARAIAGEARGETYVGMVAVAAVIINRTTDSRFPKTIPGVIYQPGAFSAVDDGQINVNPDQQALKAARDALNGFDPTGGCVYYWNPTKTTNQWMQSKQASTKIGKHNFAK